jgi:hypothetical protein
MANRVLVPLTLHLTAQDRNLVTKHEILKADLLDGAILGGEHAEQPTKQQVEERGEHGRDSVTHGWLGASGAQDHGPDGHDRVFVPHAMRNPRHDVHHVLATPLSCIASRRDVSLHLGVSTPHCFSS